MNHNTRMSTISKRKICAGWKSYTHEHTHNLYLCAFPEKAHFCWTFNLHLMRLWRNVLISRWTWKMYCMVCPARMESNTVYRIGQDVNVRNIKHIIFMYGQHIGISSKIPISIKFCIAIWQMPKPVQLQQHYWFSRGNYNYKKAWNLLLFSNKLRRLLK